MHCRPIVLAANGAYRWSGDRGNAGPSRARPGPAQATKSCWPRARSLRKTVSTAPRWTQIAQRAEVAKGTIYLYFENKEAILADLVLQALSELVEQLQAASDGRSLLHPDQPAAAPWPTPISTFAQRSPDYFRL